MYYLRCRSSNVSLNQILTSGGFMMKKTLWTLIVVLIITIIVLGFLVLPDLFKTDEHKEASIVETEDEEKPENENRDKELQENRQEISGTITDEELKQYKDEGLNPFGESTSMSELITSEYNEYIHGMSHQKIKAEKKWGFYEIHPSRIQWLLEGLAQSNLDHEAIYLEILQKWDDGDFSEVDYDHNQIWEIQGGTVGKATGILSLEEEQEYIDNK